MIFDKAEISTEAFSKEALSLAVIRDADKKIEEIRNIHQSHSTVAFCLEIWNHCAKFSDIFYLKFILTNFIRDHPPMYLPFPQYSTCMSSEESFPSLGLSSALFTLSGVLWFTQRNLHGPKRDQEGHKFFPSGTNRPISSKLSTKHSKFL